MAVIEIPAFTDNIIWGLAEDRQLVVVDPGDAAPVVAYLKASGDSLAGILITHHHADHTGGIESLVDFAGCENLPIYGPAFCQAHGVNRAVREGDVVEFQSLNIRLQVMEVPGHTQDHIAYFGFVADSQPRLFCGDTLFAGGCGRLLGGTAAQLHTSLERFKGLPPETMVHCAHEYTLSNMKFAAHALPDSSEVQVRLTEVISLREANRSTLPSRLETELQTNPFLLAQSLDEFTALRQAKDVFRAA